MKACIKNLFLLCTLITGLGLILTGRVIAQTYTNLHLFMGSNDGANPQGGLILSGNTLYGTANDGGGSGSGTVFRVNTDGSGFTNLYSFTADTSPNYTNSDGAFSQAGLILSGNILYGTANGGGRSRNGTVFAVNTNGMGFTNLYSFTGGGDGGRPQAGLILSGSTLYGTAAYGGSSGDGTVFAVNTNGTDFTNLYSFTNGSDGAVPQAGLILSGNTLYGTASLGGSPGNGTVFAINMGGTGFTNLYSFNSAINDDGNYPVAGLILSGNTLYGTTFYGGFEYGTVFSLSVTLPGVQQLTITRSGGNVILTWPTNATSFNLVSTTNLVSSAIWSPVSPAPVIVNGQNAVTNAISGTRKFYRLLSGSVSEPLLTIKLSGTSVILTWPTNFTGFTLQSTTNLVSSAIWSANSPAPIIVNEQYAVTNPISGTRKFYRLSQ